MLLEYEMFVEAVTEEFQVKLPPPSTGRTPKPAMRNWIELFCTPDEAETSDAEKFTPSPDEIKLPSPLPVPLSTPTRVAESFTPLLSSKEKLALFVMLEYGDIVTAITTLWPEDESVKV